MTSKIEQVVNFMLNNWPPDRRPVRGAAREDIARLEEAQGRPLPDGYKFFLERMGHGVEGLAFDHIDLRVETIEQFVRRSRRLKVVPKNYLLFGRDLTESELEYCFDLEGGSGSEPSVVRIAVIGLEDDMPPEAVQPDATSLAEMLFREAYYVARIEPLPYSSLHACVDPGRDPEKDDVEQTLVELELSRHPLSSTWVQGYESREGVIEVRWLKGRGLQLITASDDKEWVSYIGKELRNRLPVVLL